MGWPAALVLVALILGAAWVLVTDAGTTITPAVRA